MTPSCDSGFVERGNCGDLLGSSTCQCGDILGFPIYASGVCVDITACGSEGQRACCFLEDTTIGACEGGLTQQGSCAFDLGTLACFCPGLGSSSGVCKKPDCGQAGERACCAGISGSEEHELLGGPCGSGLVEDVSSGCAGLCQCSDSPFRSLGTCRDPTPCGGEGERGCCVGTLEFASGGTHCEAGLVAVAGCAGSLECLCGGPLAAGARSGTTCHDPAPCGGEGERACCVGERAGSPCDAGLTEIDGCSGDCFCGGSVTGIVDDDLLGTSSASCVRFEDISEPPVGFAAPPTGDSCPLRGYADLHMHLFADIAHGGGVLAGAPCPPGAGSYCDESLSLGVNDALDDCYGTDRDLVTKDDAELPNPETEITPHCPSFLPECGTALFHGDHGLANDVVGSNFGTFDGSRANVGAPAFNGWPQWSSTTHQQAYTRWLERAWRGGLRLMVQMAVTNTALCKTNKHLRGVDCDDSMAFVDEQLQAAYDFERYVDLLAGGGVDTDQGWFRIVLTPAQARSVIQDGKLAVVLGIEVDHLFNCKFPRSECTIVDDQLSTCAFTSDNNVCGDPSDPDKPSDQWVREQVDHYYDAWGVRHMFPIHNFDNSFGGTATWLSGIEVGNRFIEGHWYSTQDECADEGYGFKLGREGALIQFLAGLFGFGAGVPVPSRDEQASCSALGLLPLGEVLIGQMMQRGMLIDIDHMSNRSLDDTLALARTFRMDGYPLVASHALFFELHTPDRRHERMRTPAQLESMRAMGGMLGVMLKDDVLDTDARGERKTLDYAPSGVVDDCRHSSKTFAQAYRYAVDKMDGRAAMGSDFNGVAGHFAPRFGSDACGGDPKERSLQLREADRLVYPFTLSDFGRFDRQVSGQKVFDYNVDGLAHVGLLPDFLGDLETVGLAGPALEPLLRSAEAYIQTWERARGETVIDGCADCRLSDATPPDLACPADVVLECAGTATTVLFPDPTTTDECSVASASCAPEAGGTFARGDTLVTCESRDESDNAAQCSFGVAVTDTVSPSVSCRDVTLSLDAAGMGVLASGDVNGGSSDVCGLSGLSLDRTSFTCSDAGPNPVVLAATDLAGNASACGSTVTVVDAVAPAVACRNATLQLDAAGLGSIAPASVDGGSSDACGIGGRSISPTAFTCSDVGSNAVTLTATDVNGNSSACDSSVTVRDGVPPSAVCQNLSVVLDPSGHAVIQPESMNAGSSDGCGVASLALDKNAFTCVDAGANAVTLTVTDVNGNTASCGATVTVTRRPTTLVYEGGSGAQCSDGATLRARLTDTLSGSPLEGRPVAFAIGTQTGSAVTDASGLAAVAPHLLLTQDPGTFPLDSSFAGECTYAASSDLDAFEIGPEDATVISSDDNPVAVRVATPGGDSGPFSLGVFVNETLPDLPQDDRAAPGGIRRATVAMSLVPVGPGEPVAGTCTPQNAGTLVGDDYEILEVRCDFGGLDVNAYSSEISVDGSGCYSGAGEDVLVVYDRNGFTTGGGWFLWPGTDERTTFGYAMKYDNKDARPKGTLVLLRQRAGEIHLLESDAIDGLAVSPPHGSFGWASFTGRASSKLWSHEHGGWKKPVANQTFVAYVEDDGRNDRFWIQVRDGDGAVIGTASMEEPATSNAVELRAGEIAVRASGGPR